MVVRTYQKLVLVLVTLYPLDSFSEGIVSSPANPVIALLKMSMALAIVLGLLWGLATLLKRIQSPALQGKSGLTLVSSYNLGQREKLVVVQVGDEQLLLGVTPSAISNLHVLPAPLNAPTTEDVGSFKKTLNAAMNREIPA